MLMRCLLIISLSVKLIAIINKWHETPARYTNTIKCANELEKKQKTGEIVSYASRFSFVDFYNDRQNEKLAFDLL